MSDGTAPVDPPTPAEQSEKNSAVEVATAPDLSEIVRQFGFASVPFPRIPGYRILHEIARGGMGCVYSACDLSLGREVAIKTLLPNAKADRFLLEAKITARLPHPGIPPVYAIGQFDNGSPFLAMKLIRGKTLAHLLSTEPPSDKNLAHYERIFEQVAQAVGFAHQQGIIHRDLKPANIMVGEFGEVQVMDWGLAKDLRQSDRDTVDAVPRDLPVGLTQAGYVVGTPGYISPEQARGEALDARSDVFALGSLLSMILTQAPAVTGWNPNEALQQTARGQFSELHHRLNQCSAPAELIDLARRCLAYDRNQRPANGQEVADAMMAYRVNAEVRLRKAEAERALALLREAEQRKRLRNRLFTAAALVGVFAVGLAVSWWQTLRAIAAENQANHLSEELLVRQAVILAERQEKEAAWLAERDARQQEAEARQRAFQALRSMTDRVVETKFTQATSLSEDDRKFLVNVIEQYKAFAALQGNDRATRVLRAEGQGRIAQIRARLGESVLADGNYSQAIALRQQLVADYPDEREYARALGGTYLNRAILRMELDRNQESEADFAQALQLARSLVQQDPSFLEGRVLLAQVVGSRGILYDKLRRFTEAEADFRATLQLRRCLVEQHPLRHDFIEGLIKVHNNYGIMLHRTRRLRDAEENLLETLRLHQQLVTLTSRNADSRKNLAACYGNLASVKADLGKLAEAEADYNQSIDLRTQLVSEFPSRPEFRLDLAHSYLNRGWMRSRRAHFVEASTDLAKAIELYKPLVTEHPQRRDYLNQLATTYSRHGVVLRALGRFAEAESQLFEAIQLQRKLLQAFPKSASYQNNLAVSLVELANVKISTKKLPEAHQLLQQALSYQQSALQADPKNSYYIDSYRVHWLLCLRVRLGLDSFKDVLEAVEQLRQMKDLSASQAHETARYLANMIAAIRKTSQLSPEQLPQLTNPLATAAVEMLQLAMHRGAIDRNQLKQDPAFQVLHDHPAFQKLFAPPQKTPREPKAP